MILRIGDGTIKGRNNGSFLHFQNFSPHDNLSLTKSVTETILSIKWHVMNILSSLSLYALILKWTRFTLALLDLFNIWLVWLNLHLADLFAINEDHSFPTIPKAIHVNIFFLSLSKKWTRMEFSRVPGEGPHDAYKFWRILPPSQSD